MSRTAHDPLNSLAAGDSRRFWRELLVHHPEAWQLLRMDEVLRATAALPSRHAGAAALSNIFVVGSFATRITVHDQQWLGCEVAEAVARLPRRNKSLPVAVIGASFAGTSAALWLASRRNRHPGDLVELKLFDEHDCLLGKHRSSGCTVHPNAWDWPLLGWNKGKTEFPEWVAPLNWSTEAEGRSIGDIASTIARAIEVHAPTGKAKWFRPGQGLKCGDIQADPEGVRIRVGTQWERFGAAILCVGFGEPRELKAANGDQAKVFDFWHGCRAFTCNRSHVVVGAGDSALMNAIQWATGRDSLDLLRLADQCGLGEHLGKLGERFMALDQQYELYRSFARDSGGIDWCYEYEQRVLEFLASVRRAGVWPKWREWGRVAMESGANVALIARAPLFQSRSSRINRVLCMLLHAATQFETDRIPESLFDHSRPERQICAADPTRTCPTGADDSATTGQQQEGVENGESPDNAVLANAAGQALTSFRGEYVPKDGGVPKGLTVAEGFHWLGPAGDAGAQQPRSHLFAGPDRTGSRSTRTLTIPLEAVDFVPCVGQLHPTLLQELSDRIDLENLIARQRDWKWY